ncbi:F0F1 ATP synthase subunit delta [Halobacillus salinarum]|uniref:ATP synthase subunit delta n=1 Tax=Halobacillus salinarum TaxID=2932257 RepID=A0ABY4ETA4_9BACI|nr:F0F1 ATP synthase subunit delta [Halobacillus salinarum]UOQ45356.1 F0F1 ATP synthase subunit delta [Halobacillus salinarum]
MSVPILAKRYAQALFQLAQERSKLEQFETELRTMREVLSSNDKLFTFLKHPKVSLDQKKKVIDESFGAFSSELVNTSKLLLERHREGIIPEMAGQFIALMNEKKGIADATVYSVRALSDDEKQKISQTFAAKVGKQSLNITNITEPNLLGGLRVRIGNRIFDGSVRGKLNRIERELVSKY